MLALIQRVTRASVSVAGEKLAEIGPGMLALVAVERGDAADQARRMAERLLNYRIFADDKGQMNLNLAAAGGELMLVPQFTLAADTNSGNRPGFSGSAAPEEARQLFDQLTATVHRLGCPAPTGRFGADMQVELVNDGPVTFLLQVPPFRF